MGDTMSALLMNDLVEDTPTIQASYFQKQCEARQSLCWSMARPVALYLLPRPSFFFFCSFCYDCSSQLKLSSGADEMRDTCPVLLKLLFT